jgi:hypothetical protein
MKAAPVRLTTPYPSLAKMAKTLGASKSEVARVKRLVRKAMLSKKSAAPRHVAQRAAG